jgi:soluble lytic murein transglycosylase-like protein
MRRFGQHHRNVTATLGLALASMAMPPLAIAQQIYVGSSESGAIVLSGFRSASTPQLLLDGASKGPADRRGSFDAAVKSRSPLLDSLINRIASEVSISPQLLHAVIAAESGYDSRAVSPKGAQGLMQLMPATAQRFGVQDPFDPEQNVRAGATFLRSLLDAFAGDTRLALAAYNAGESAVIRAGNRIPAFPETQAYVPRVLASVARAR